MKKKKQPPFIMTLQKKLDKLMGGKIKVSYEKGGDSNYIILSQNGFVLSFEMDKSGDNIEQICIAKEVVEVVDEKLLHSFTTPPQK